MIDKIQNNLDSSTIYQNDTITNTSEDASSVISQVAQKNINKEFEEQSNSEFSEAPFKQLLTLPIPLNDSKKSNLTKSVDIWEACKNGDLQGVRKFISAFPANINDKNENGQTLLHLAIQKNNKDMVEYLIAKGADIKAKDSEHVTPLGRAVINTILNIYLGSFSSVNTLECYSIIALLIVAGADIDQNNFNYAATVYHIPITHTQIQDFLFGILTSLKELMDNNVEVKIETFPKIIEASQAIYRDLTDERFDNEKDLLLQGIKKGLTKILNRKLIFQIDELDSSDFNNLEFVKSLEWSHYRDKSEFALNLYRSQQSRKLDDIDFIFQE